VFSDIDEAIQVLSVWKKQRKKLVKPLSKNIAYKPTFDVEYIREAVLYRFIELAESSYQLYRSNLLVGAIVSARAAQETLAVVWFINTKLEHLSKTKELAHFRTTFERLLVGWSNNDEFPDKINVLTCIDSVDKSMEGMFRKHYETLCEYSHPNYSGTFGAYGMPNQDTLEVILGQYPRSEERLKKIIESSIMIFVSLLDSIQENYEEAVNSALNVCLELHEQGKLEEHI